jgi:hypothetical protein
MITANSKLTEHARIVPAFADGLPTTVALTGNGTTAAGNSTLHFAATTGVVPGMAVNDVTSPAVIQPGTVVVSTTATTVVMSKPAVGAGVGATDAMTFVSTPARVSMKGYQRAAIVITAQNATTVTGSAITLLQSTDLSGTGEKAVPFTTVQRNLDVAAGEVLTDAAVTSNTFTTDATDQKTLQYIIDVRPEMLDVDNGFDCFRVGVGTGVATTLTVEYILWDARYGKSAQLPAEH